MSHLMRAKHVASLMGLDEERTRFIDYSYCQSLEELDSALLRDFLREDIPETEAHERASYFAAIMWTMRH